MLNCIFDILEDNCSTSDWFFTFVCLGLRSVPSLFKTFFVVLEVFPPYSTLLFFQNSPSLWTFGAKFIFGTLSGISFVLDALIS